MKKLGLFVVLLCFMLAGITGCGTDQSADVQPAAKDIATKEINIKDAQNVEEFNEEEVISKLQVEKYEYKGKFSNYIFLVVKNNSDVDIEIEAAVNLKDENGNLIGAKRDSVDAFEAGQNIALGFAIDDDYNSFDYEFSVSPEEYYSCILSNLKCETNIAKDKAVISVTNNGDIPAEFVEYMALFFKNGNIVNYDRGYVTDDDSEIKPGKTINEEADCYDDFDEVRVYLTGRGEK